VFLILCFSSASYSRKIMVIVNVCIAAKEACKNTNYGSKISTFPTAMKAEIQRNIN
jgi:hypothetical protein